MLEFLISLFERDRDDDIHALTQQKSTMNAVDVMALASHKDRDISKAFRTAMSSLSNAQTGLSSSVHMSNMMTGRQMPTCSSVIVLSD